MSSSISSHESCKLTPELDVVALVAQEPDGGKAILERSRKTLPTIVVDKPISLRATLHVRAELAIIRV